MKVLFVSSGKPGDTGIAPFIEAQGESLARAGIALSYFPVAEKGLYGYLKAAVKLREYLKTHPVDLIHAHYVLSGWTAVLAFPKQPVVLSLMGTDAYGEYIGVNKVSLKSRYLIWLTKTIQPFVDAIICKSRHIEKAVYLTKKSRVIPNGILLDQVIADKAGFREALLLDPRKKYILFLGNKAEKRKNYPLLKQAANLCDSEMVSVIAPYPIDHKQVVQYLNSVDVVVVPSLMEGSPNVVKEAMACKCPVVATDVGDARWVIGDTPGCYVTAFDPEDMADKISQALVFSSKHGRTRGRQRIIELGLDAGTIAEKVIQVYRKCLEENR